MFPYQWGGEPFTNPMGAAMGAPFLGLGGSQWLPEEIREAIEEHQGEIRSESDMQRFVDEMMLRR